MVPTWFIPFPSKNPLLTRVEELGRKEHAPVVAICAKIESEIADLEDDARDFLEAASCCGFEFDPTLVAEALGSDLMGALRRFGFPPSPPLPISHSVWRFHQGLS